MRKMKPSGVEWIGDIPQEWEVIKLKYATEFKQIKYSEEYGELNYIGLENIISWNGMYLETSSQYDREQSLICEENDILFGKLRPYLAKVYLNTKRQCCSSEFCVIKILENNTKYFWYQLISHGFIFMVDRSTYGTKMPRANSDFIRSLYVSIPPLFEQQRIAEFLDRKCAEIDSVISKTKATIEEYKALKQAVITQAVTKGIRPDRPMKDSGVEWIGDIPQEWEISKLKYLCKMQAGKNITSEEISTNGDFPVYGGNGIRGYYEKYNTVGKHLLVGRQGALCGNVHKVEGYFWATEHCVVTLGSSLSYRDFLYYLLFAMNLNQYASNTAAQPGLSVNMIQNISTCIVPIPEQQEIADYLDHKCAEIDRLIAAKEQLLTELESYKKSVIYEYVTGKKFVSPVEIK